MVAWHQHLLTQSSDLDLSSKLLIKRRFLSHAGQVCVSVQRVFIHKKIFDDFLDLFTKNLENFKIGDPLDKKTDIGPLIRPSEVERVHSWIKEAEKDGAKLLAGGKKISETSYDKTILLNPNDSSTISKNEVFGPVVCIYAYDDFDNTIEKANSTDVSFQASIFSNEIKEVLNFYDKINASAVFHNDHTAFRVDWMPFAGLKHSGMVLGELSILWKTCKLIKC